MKNANTIGLLATISLLAILYAVYFFWLRTPKNFVVANGSQQTINFRLNSEKFELAAGQMMEYDAEDSVRFTNEKWDTVFALNPLSSYLLNPTQSEYVVFYRPYGVVPNRDSLFTSKTTEWNEKVYFGNMEVKTDLLLSGFDYNLNQEYPTWNRKKGKEITVLSKVFGPESFRNFYFEQYE